MSKIHYFQRYSSIENTVTNNTLQLLARIYDYSASAASDVLSQLTGDEIEIGIEIKQQARVGNAVPDGSRGCKKLCVSGHIAGNCLFQKWIKNDDHQSLTHATQRFN
jgi:hypothetical protein